MGLATIDVIVVVAYAICIFGLAQWVSREKGGKAKDTSDYFLASKNLPWWAIGASLIAANISAEQIVGMSGSGYAIGLAIASYEWMAALTLVIVGKYFLPIFLENTSTRCRNSSSSGTARSIRTADGHLLARAVRLREPDLDHVARLDRGERRSRASIRTSRSSRSALFALLYQL